MGTFKKFVQVLSRKELGQSGDWKKASVTGARKAGKQWVRTEAGEINPLT